VSFEQKNPAHKTIGFSGETENECIISAIEGVGRIASKGTP
jgi:hypothetical protein